MPPLLVFDGDCGFCTACVNLARRRIRPEARIEPWQTLELGALGLTVEQCAEAVQFVDDDGSVSSGSRAVTAMLRTAPRPWPWVGAVGDAPVLRRLADVAYRTIARNRYRLPGSTPACAIRP